MLMKRSISTVAILLPLFFFAACGPSKSPEANASAASPAAHAASITASPNPVTTGEGNGTTTITWNTGDGATGQVYVSEDGAPETLFTAGPPGSLRHLGSARGKHLSFVFMRELSTPKCLPKLRSRVANKSRIASPCGCFSVRLVRSIAVAYGRAD